MGHQKTRNLLVFIGMVLFIIGWLVLFYFYTPAELIDWLGVTNSYLVAFLISIFGAIASATPVSTYPALYTMAAGGISPLALVPLAALGLTTGDLIFVYVGLSARQALPEKIIGKIERLLQWLHDKPDWVAQLTIFIWVGLLPIANNILTAPLAITGFPVKKMIPPLVLGNTTFPLMATLLGWYGLEIFFLEA